MSVATRAAGAAGPLLLTAAARGQRAFVALYHRVSPAPDPAYPPMAPRELERHLDLLESRFRIVPLPELARRVATGDDVHRCCAITFDDGYRDFLDHAYPILARRRIPVTHFLVADSVATGVPTWNYRLNRTLRAADEAERLRQKAELGALLPEERDQRLAERERELGIGPDAGLLLGPDDLGRVDPELVDWQSHGTSHAMMSTLPADRLATELDGSRAAIEGWTGRPVHAFSYPNGDTSPAASAAVAAAGYESAWIVGDRPVRPGTSTFELPRFDLGRFPAAAVPLVLGGGLRLKQAVGR